MWAASLAGVDTMPSSEGLKQRVRKRLAEGRLRSIAGAAYRFIIAGELAFERFADAAHPCREAQDDGLLEELTALVKTFERPRVLRRLVESMKRMYPRLRVLVVDDSHHPVPIEGVETILLPFDSGVSAGRREGLRHVTTRYVLVLDDDFVFYRRTDLVSALRLMEEHPQIDIMGGQVITLPFYRSTDYRDAWLFPTHAEPTMPPGSAIGGLPVQDKVADFFIGRTERVRLVNWDPALKRVDHADFFTRAVGVLTTVYNADLKCLHAQTPFDVAYMRHREDWLADNAVLQYRWGKRTAGR